MALKILLYPLILLAMAATAWAGPKVRRPAQPASANAEAQAALAKARERVLTAQPLAMFYYSDDSSGLESLQAHAGAITLLAPQCYGLDRAGTLHGQLPPESWTWRGAPDCPSCRW